MKHFAERGERIIRSKYSTHCCSVLRKFTSLDKKKKSCVSAFDSMSFAPGTSNIFTAMPRTSSAMSCVQVKKGSTLFENKKKLIKLFPNIFNWLPKMQDHDRLKNATLLDNECLCETHSSLATKDRRRSQQPRRNNRDLLDEHYATTDKLKQNSCKLFSKSTLFH